MIDTSGDNSVEVSAVIPCLNESETLETCIRKAQSAFERHGIRGEVVVADNGSTDGSQSIAESCGARVIDVPEKGYGSALMGGIESARGVYVIMADADDSYDWGELGAFVERLHEGFDIVQGCRFPRGGGTILPGAMPWSHRMFGNPVLSALARFLFDCPVNDMYCGMRGFDREFVMGLNLRVNGMEFAYEMLIKATFEKARIAEIPITLHPDGRMRGPHLRTLHDGWRTLRFMLLYSPTWLFHVPGILFLLIGLLGFLLILPGPLPVGFAELDAHTLLICGMLCVIGFQCIGFGEFARVFAIDAQLLPAEYPRLYEYVRLETGLLFGAGVALSGGALAVFGVVYWARSDFGALSYGTGLRIMIPAVTLISLGLQVVFTSFMLSFLGLNRRG